MNRKPNTITPSPTSPLAPPPTPFLNREPNINSKVMIPNWKPVITLQSPTLVDVVVIEKGVNNDKNYKDKKDSNFA